jgi:hypothetical protein
MRRKSGAASPVALTSLSFALTVRRNKGRAKGRVVSMITPNHITPRTIARRAWEEFSTVMKRKVAGL